MGYYYDRQGNPLDDAIIRTEMVTLDQVMLPYMRGDDGQTIYELYVNRQLALPAGSD